MKRFLFSALPVVVLLTTGCVVAPRQAQQMPSYPSNYPSAYPNAYPDEYVPPPEYVVDGPLYYDTYPGVPFYPIFIDTPGSCYCVMPMRYSGGVWWGVTGTVIYRGFFPYRRVEPVHRSYWQQQGGVVNGMRPSRGVFENRDGRLHPIPPAGSIHFRAVEQRNMNRPASNVPSSGQNSGPSGQSAAPQRPFQNQGQPPPVLAPQNRPVQASPFAQPQLQQQPQHQPQQPQTQQQQPPQLQRPLPHPEESSPRVAPQNRSGQPESRSGQNEPRSRSSRCQDDDKHEKRC